MYLHIGNDYLINSNDIVGIFDLDNTSFEKITRDFLADKTKKNLVISESSNLPKSFIVVKDKEKNEKLYLSQLSSATLVKRLASGSNDLIKMTNG